MLAEVRGTWVGPIDASSPEIARLFARPPTSTGVAVSEQTALTYSAVWAAVSLIASNVASLPLILYKRLPNGGKERLIGHPLYRLLHDQPNAEMTSMVFRETLQAHVLTWGNGYAEIERDQGGRPVALWPLTPDRVQPFREERSLRLRYRVRNAAGLSDVVIEAPDMLHVPGLGYDGTCGYSVIAKARESIGLGLATERFGGTFFGQGSTFGGVLEHPKQLGEIAQKKLRASINERHQGVDRAHRFLILEEGMQYKRLGIPPNDAQFLETRKFQIAEVARWFNMPPHKLRDLERATFSNIEHQNIEWVVDTLRNWLVRWEQEINRKLVASTERNIQFAEHLVDGLLRGDIASRYAAYAIGRQWGWLSADDVREKENMNPLPDGSGQQYLVPLNMVPADRMDEVIDKQVAPAPTPPALPPPPQEDDEDDPAVDAEEKERALARVEDALARVQASILTELQAAGTALNARVEALPGLIVPEVVAPSAKAEAAAAAVALAVAHVDEAVTRVDISLRTDLQAAVTAQQAHLEALPSRVSEAVEPHLAAVARDVEARALTLAAVEARATDAAAQLLEARAEVERERQAGAALAETARLTAEAEAASRAVAVAAHQTALSAAAAQAAQAAETERSRLAAALDAQRATEAARLTAVIAAHRALFVDAAGRLLRIEADRARRAQATPEKLRRWIETFYPVHEDVCRMAFLPALRAHLAWMQSDADPVQMAATMATQHVEDSRRQLTVVLDVDVGTVNESLETVLRRWEGERADQIADRVLQEAVSYVRTTGR